MHQDHHEGGGADQGHADDVQTHCQPAHRTAEQIKRSLVLVQQNLVPENKNTVRLCRSGPGSEPLSVNLDLFRKFRPWS